MMTAATALLCLGAGSARAGAPQQPIDDSRLAIAVAVKNGHLSVDRVKSSFTPSSRFNSRASLTGVEAAKVIYDDLDRAFAQLAGLYWYALSDDEKTLDGNGKLNDAATSQVRAFTGDWKAFGDLFNRWAASGPNRFPLQMVFSGVGVLQDVTNFDQTTAVIFDDPDSRDFDAGTLSFRVADPVGDWITDTSYQIAFANAAAGAKLIATPAKIAGILRPLRGKLWRPSDVRGRIDDFYAGRGFQSSETLSRAGENPKRVVILESLRSARLVVPVSADNSLDQILYLLLTDTEFRQFIRNRTKILNDSLTTAGGSDFRAIDYVTSLGRAPGNEPYVNLFRLQIAGQQLGLLGFAITQTPSGARQQLNGITYVDLQVARTAADSPTPKAAAAAPLLASSDGVINPNLQEGARQTPFVPASPGPTTKTAGGGNGSTDGPRKNYLGGGFVYTPAQGVKLIGIYQRSQIFSDNDSFSVKAGGQQSALGGLNYFADYVGFGSLHRRLSLQFTGSSDFFAKRIFNHAETDERRTGGLARAELELFRDLAGNLLRLSAEGRHTTVELTRSSNTVTKQNLTTLEIGGLYLFDHSAAEWPRTVRIEPRVRIGLGLANGEPSYTRMIISGNFHQKLPNLVEIDLSGRLETATEQTPIFEVPSLGGAESVRGFRADDALARRLWSLQSELWLPVPGSNDPTGGVSRFLRRNIRLAGFIDLGGAYSTRDSVSGLRMGPGVGLRLIYNPVVLKLDWAYGIGDGSIGNGRGRFYMSVSTNLPF